MTAANPTADAAGQAPAPAAPAAVSPPAAPPGPPAAYPPLQGTALLLGTLSLSLATFMNVLDSSIANVSIPAIAGDLGVSPGQGTWVITSFGVANAISVPLTGWLTQRFGAVRLFTMSVLLFVLTSWLCGFASSLEMLVFFRVLQGLVAGPMIPLSQTLLLASYPRALAGTALALWGVTPLVAPVVGPLLGGWITDNISWPWIFYINVPVGLLAGVLTWGIYRKRETPIRKLPIDTVGLSLLVLTLVIGILVDDAIVEIENIEKRIESGESPYRASMIGADQIGLAVIATTFAIVVVFLPVSLMGGIVGQYFREFGVTVAVAVLFSLLVARLLTPLMCAYLLVPARTLRARRPMAGWYRRILDWALDHRGLSILLAFLFFAGSLGLASLLPTAFIPESNPKSMVFNIVAAPGSTRADLDRVSGEATRILKGQPDVASVFARFGGEAMHNGSLTVVFKEDRTGTAAAFKRRVASALGEIRDVRITPSGQNGGSADLEVILVGNDPLALEAAARRVQHEMRGIPGLRNVRAAEPASSPELVIRPRLAEAARLGLTAEAIADAARIATIGDVDANLAKLPIDGRNLPARALLPSDARLDLATIAGLRVPIQGGGTTRLDAVADIGFEAGPGRIERIDRQRRATIQADISGLTLGQATDAVAALPGMKALPAGVQQLLYGDSEAMSELFGGFIGAMIAGIGMIFAVLVLLFRSFFKPVTILTALPLAVGGAFGGLLLGGLALSLPAMIGFLMLLGLAAKNSILLVEYAIERERRGAPRRAALIEACHERARPIVMTTVAMAAGMMPTALGLGEGSEFRQPMAVAVIGGLITSTALSLVLVPVAYEAIDMLERWLAPRFGRLVRQPDPREVAALRTDEAPPAAAPMRP